MIEKMLHCCVCAHAHLVFMVKDLNNFPEASFILDLALLFAVSHHPSFLNGSFFYSSEFERRQAKPIEVPPPREEENHDLQQKTEEVRQPPPRVRPVPSLVPRPPQTSLVKFVGNIYTLKCRHVPFLHLANFPYVQ